MPDRLRQAVENGHVVLPEGGILALEPRNVADLMDLDPSCTCVKSRLFSVTKQVIDAGWAIDALPEFAAVVIFLPRARAAQKALIKYARSVTTGPIIIDGDKTDGVEALIRELRARADVSAPWSKAHGKIFTLNGGDFGDWPVGEPVEAEDGWWRAPGVFSADGIDPASAALAEALPTNLSGHVVDMGAGWGYLSRAILQREDVSRLDLVEDDGQALAAAEHNLSDTRAAFHWADALTWQPDALTDHVVTNPPFHKSRKADPSLGQAFIRAAARILNRQGTLWLVANRHLPYETVLEETFRDVHLLKETAQFKLFRANQPRARRKG